MQFITSLFGGSGNTVLTAVFALGIVLVLILLAVWLLKVLFNASGRVARGRNRRLSVIDTLSLDPKRQLIIIRRDNVEHLILTGGPQDVVVETGIPVDETLAAQPTRRPIPMVASRKPVQPPAPAVAPAAPPAPPAPLAKAVQVVVPPAPVVEPEVVPGSAIEQLRKMGKPTDKRAHLSLRHTGLLRPINAEDSADNAGKRGKRAQPATDSAKEDGAQRDVEGIDLVDGNNEANRN